MTAPNTVGVNPETLAAVSGASPSDVGGVQRSFLASFKPKSGRGLTNLNTGYTYQMALAAESSFSLVRAVFANDSTASPWTVENASFAAAASVNDFITPLGPSGSAVSWVNATFHGAGQNLEYGAQPGSGGAATLSVPAATDATNPALAATDWMPVSSVAREDAGQSLPLLFLRVKAAAASPLGAGRGPQGAANDDFSNALKWPSVSRGTVLRCNWKSGNFITNAAGFVSPVNETGLLPVLGVQFYLRRPGVSVMTVGDSLTAGFQTVVDANSFGFVACKTLSNQFFPAHHVNAGWNGQTVAQFIARGYREFDWFRPDIVVIETSSPNGALDTQAHWDEVFGRASAFADYVRRRGSVPILKTSVPYAYSATRDALRRAHNTRVINAGVAAGILVLDADAAVTAGGTPAIIRPEYKAAADNHMNDAGHAAVAQALVPLLLKAFAGLRTN